MLIQKEFVYETTYIRDKLISKLSTEWYYLIFLITATSSWCAFVWSGHWLLTLKTFMATGVYQNPLYTIPNEPKPIFPTITLTSFAEITQSAKHWMGKFCISFVLTSFADKIISPSILFEVSGDVTGPEYLKNALVPLDAKCISFKGSILWTVKKMIIEY